MAKWTQLGNNAAQTDGNGNIPFFTQSQPGQNVDPAPWLAIGGSGIGVTMGPGLYWCDLTIYVTPFAGHPNIAVAANLLCWGAAGSGFVAFGPVSDSILQRENVSGNLVAYSQAQKLWKAANDNVTFGPAAQIFPSLKIKDIDTNTQLNPSLIPNGNLAASLIVVQLDTDTDSQVVYR